MLSSEHWCRIPEQSARILRDEFFKWHNPTFNLPVSGRDQRAFAAHSCARSGIGHDHAFYHAGMARTFQHLAGLSIHCAIESSLPAFVPAGVGMMVHFDRIINEWLPISIALILSTVITMAATAAIMLASRCLLAKKGQKDD